MLSRVFIFVLFPVAIFSQTGVGKSPRPEPDVAKLFEFKRLTNSDIQKTIVPFWKTLSCNDAREIYIVNYGTTRATRVRARAIGQSWGFKCDLGGERPTFVDGGKGSVQTRFWRVRNGAKVPI